MQSGNDDTIPVWSLDSEMQVEGTKALFRPDVDAVLSDIPVAKLKKNLESLCEGVARATSDLRAIGNFQLRKVSVQVEISAEGGVSLVGTAKLGGKGGVTLEFASE